jgi:hypothetical protein
VHHHVWPLEELFFSFSLLISPASFLIISHSKFYSAANSLALSSLSGYSWLSVFV